MKASRRVSNDTRKTACWLTIFLAAAAVTGPVLAAQSPAAALKILVLEGEDGVNIIDQKTAVKPVVEVRDRNDLPVAGASIVFFLGGGSATLNNGVRQVTLTTDAAGRASVTVNPVSRGAVQLQVRASYQGQTATTTINQTNFQTAAQAAQAGKSPGSQSGSQAGTSAGGAAGAGAAGGAAAGAAGAAAGGAAGAGGLSGAVIGGIVAAGAGGAFAVAKVAGNKEPENRAPTAGGVTASPTTALAGANTISFSVQGSDPDNDPLTYTWDFGDGGTGTGASTTHSYSTAGTFTVRVTINDGKQSVSAQTTVTIRTLSGAWRTSGGDSTYTCTVTLTLTQSGSTFNGTGVDSCSGSGFDSFSYTGPVTNGSVKTTSPRITFTWTLSVETCSIFYAFSGDPSTDGNTITGTVSTSISAGVCSSIAGLLSSSAFSLTRQ